MSLDEIYRGGSVVLTDGGIETRLIYEFGCSLPEFAAFLALLEPRARTALSTIYRSYLAVAREFGIKMQLGTPTWRAHPECLARLGFGATGDVERVNAAAVAFLKELRDEVGLADSVAIAGVIGPRRDGYDPKAAPGAMEARDYHAVQAGILAGLGVDLLYAPTFASVGELRGVAAAMAATGLPYMLAPVIDAEARLLDGTKLAAAIAEIDAAVSPVPLRYLIGCVHPTRLSEAFAYDAASLEKVAPRIAGLKANASTLPPDQLDRLDHLDEGSAADFADDMVALRHAHGFGILGGCCGTSDRHIRALGGEARGRRRPLTQSQRMRPISGKRRASGAARPKQSSAPSSQSSRHFATGGAA
jgi:S-methylmethionine-dependent homocysteine/selenocysteine methylase